MLFLRKHDFDNACARAHDVVDREAHHVRKLPLQRATPHWLRHKQAIHALANGATLTTVRDNLRHASITTTRGRLFRLSAMALSSS
jgi:site-specific recombinase XerD